MFNKKSPLAGRFFVREKGGQQSYLDKTNLSEEGENDQGHQREKECELDFLVSSLRRFLDWGSTFAFTFVTANFGALATFTHLLFHKCVA